MKVFTSIKQIKTQQPLPKPMIQKQIIPESQSIQNENQWRAIAQKAKLNHKKKISLFKQIYSCISFPVTLLLLYFTFQMLLFASLELVVDIYSSFAHFFSRIKTIFQQNSLFLLFWAVIIIKTKLPQIKRLFYHTIVRSMLENQQTQCSICLNQDCDYILPKCNHHYHAICLQKWLKSQACCPYCRAKTEKHIVRNVPWKLFFESITKNKIKWTLIVIVCLFVQYRFSDNNFFILSIRQKINAVK